MHSGTDVDLILRLGLMPLETHTQINDLAHLLYMGSISLFYSCLYGNCLKEQWRERVGEGNR